MTALGPLKTHPEDRDSRDRAARARAARAGPRAPERPTAGYAPRAAARAPG